MKNRTEQLCGNPYEVAVRLPRFDVRPVDPPVPAETTGGSLSFEDPDVMNSGTTTNLAGGSPEVTAPVRLEGQTDSEVLFTWLLVNRNLWMLEKEHDAELERILDTEARLHLGYKLIQWKREPKHKSHPALAAPEDGPARLNAFARLERLIKVHLFLGSDGATVERDRQ